MNSDNSRIAKNTLFLYGRMVITMLIGMWTSRLVLNALGFTDQGLYNVVGGFVGFLSLVTASIGNSIGRYITFELGRDNKEGIKKAIQNAIAIQLVLCIIVLILAETIGLWYINNKLVVDSGRLFAVNVVYQFSVGSFILSILCSTANGLIIAHEKLGVFAAIAICTSVCNLAIGIIITYYGHDRLIFYSALQFCINLATRIFSQIYAKSKFPYCSYMPKFNKEVFKPMFSFAGWNMIGTSAAILRGSGTSVLLNYFGGPIANTINGIANQINIIASLFVKDFTTAFNPQITKKFASGSPDLVPFISRCSKFSYFLLMVMMVPIFLNIEPLLVFWLKKIPDGTVIFAQLIMIFTAIECISRPLITAKDATGKIAAYQGIVGGILLLTIPLSYTFLKLGFPIYYSYVAFIITSIGAFFARMVMLRGSIPGWSSYTFLTRTCLKCFYTTIIGALLPIFFYLVFPRDFRYVILQCIFGFLWCVTCVYLIGCNKSERKAICKMLDTLKNKIFPKKCLVI